MKHLCFQKMREILLSKYEIELSKDFYEEWVENNPYEDFLVWFEEEIIKEIIDKLINDLDCSDDNN